jgi:suppressor for copper-sensitivity B
VRISAPLPAAHGGEPGGGIRFSAAKYGEAAAAPLPIAAATAGNSTAGQAAAATPGDGTRSPTMFAPDTSGPETAAGGRPPLTLPLVLLMGVAGGLLLNLMPCVLPVLGLKLMSFAQQSGRARREVFEMNLWYCAGLFAVFFVLATASVAANLGLGSTNLAWGEQFTSTNFNIAMVAVVFVFALSFLGVWELPIPGFIGEQAGHVQSREGPAGAFLKGVLSTVLATPCSGPFLGPVFGFTLTQPTPVTYAVFGAIATGMALPYILVGFFPALVRFLPKPGAWMATFKELLGFVMLGTVVYLFTFLNHEWFVPTLALLVGLWAACWWVGRAQQKLGGGVGFGRWVQAAAFATAVGTASFMLLGPVRSLIEWEEPFSRNRLAELWEDGNTVMVDFSADWCPTCKFNLATAIETRRVKAVVDRNRVVPMLADWTDGSLEIKQMLESLESRSIPVLAIFPGGEKGKPRPEPIVLRDLLTERQVLDALEQAGPSCCPPPEIRAASTAPVTAGR